MREVQILIRDDFDGTPDAETVTFAFQGSAYEIDLSAEHLAELEEAMAPYLKAARPAKIDSAGKAPTGGSQGTSIERARSKIRNGEHIPNYLVRTAELVRVRDWANANGWNIVDRARIPNQVHEAYNRAHPSNPVYTANER